MLKKNSRIEEFELYTETGELFESKKISHHLVLFFYPKDNTPL